MMKRFFLMSFFILISLAACENPEWGRVPAIPETTTYTSVSSISPTATLTLSSSDLSIIPFPTQSVSITPRSPTPSLAPESWKSMPIVPNVSQHMIEIYRAGLAAGRDPAHFSKIGDCQNITTYFLSSFDNPDDYRLGGQYAYLQPTIDHFAGSWSRKSLAVAGGMNVAAVQNPFWTLTPRPNECNKGETPLACEIRVYNPSIVTISMEESWSGDIVKYDRYMRQIVEYVLSQNVVPILTTRAEVPGSINSINETLAKIAYDYQVPLWNFWAATDPLPSHGLTADSFHLTQARNFFDDPKRMEAGWPWRNLTALQSIDTVYRLVNGLP